MIYIIKIITGYIFYLSTEKKKLKIDNTMKILLSRLILSISFPLLVEYMVDFVFTILGFHNSFSTSFLLINDMHHTLNDYIIV